MLTIHEFSINPESISLYFLSFFALVLIFNYWWYFSRMAFRKSKKLTNSKSNIPLSVVICAKNEYHNLKENLPLVIEQVYPDFEVIVVNDFSEDDSYFLLKDFEEQYPHFKVINLRENVNFFAGKKLALAVGIKSAKYDTVVLTDADCAPAGKDWLTTISSGFVQGGEIVLGYGGYRKSPGLLNRLICYDTVSVAMQYMGYALAGRPYMGVGRNLAYKKDLFYKTGGFASHYKISSGDDDLFVNMAATKSNTSVVMQEEGHTISDPKKRFTSWFIQKKRHMATGAFYKTGDKFRLGLLALSNTMFYIMLAVFLVFVNRLELLYIALGIILLKVISLMVLHYYAGKRLNEKKLFLYSPIFDVIFAFLNPVFAISNLFYRKNKWK